MMHLLDDAEKVARGTSVPAYSRREYEDAMLDLAKREAREGESTAVAFARLCEERDPRVESLYTAGRQAEMEEVRRAADHRREAIETGRLQEDLRKQHEARQSVMGEMNSYANRFRLEGESEERAFSRLLETDPEMRCLYAKYREQ